MLNGPPGHVFSGGLVWYPIVPTDKSVSPERLADVENEPPF